MWGSQARKVKPGKGKGQPLEKGEKGKFLEKASLCKKARRSGGRKASSTGTSGSSLTTTGRPGTGTTSWKRRAGRVTSSGPALLSKTVLRLWRAWRTRGRSFRRSWKKVEKRLEERKLEEFSAGAKVGGQRFLPGFGKGQVFEKEQADSKPLQKGSSSSSSTKPQQKAMPKPRVQQQPSSTPYQPTLTLRSRPGFSQSSSFSEPLKKGQPLEKGQPLDKGQPLEKGKGKGKKGKQDPQMCSWKRATTIERPWERP